MKKIVSFFVFVFFFVFLFKIYYQKIGAFGCFDDCFNFTAGYFLLQGKKLYSEIFFNHQPLMAVFSYLVQLFSHPETLYKFILYHRIAVFIFAFLMDFLFLFRFGWKMGLFILFFEPTKYYLFGDHFLAEAVIVYPLVYLAGLLWEKLGKKDLSVWDYLTSAIFTWLVIFMREPFVPVALFLYSLILWNKKDLSLKYFSAILFLSLSILTLLLFPLEDYLFNVFKANVSFVLPTQALNKGIFDLGIIKIFAYPLYILLGDKWNYFRDVLVGLDLIFLSSVAILVVKKKMSRGIVLFFIIMGLANIRFVPPGTIFYEAFHLLPWYGLFLMTTSLLMMKIYALKNKRLNMTMTFLLIFVFGFIFFSPQAFFREKTNKDYEFTTNYANYFTSGTVIKLLADPQDTLFVDGFDELIYWQAKVPSSYRYSFYTSIMPRFAKYKDERERMFMENPPVFYFGSCPEDLNPERQLPKEAVHEYERLYFAGKPSCLFVKKTKIPSIDRDKWKEIEKLEYYLPKSNLLE